MSRSSFFKTAFIVGVPVFYLRTFHIKPIVVEGNSMQPTLNPTSNHGISDRLIALHTKHVQENDIVVLTHPQYPHKPIIKRISAIGPCIVYPHTTISKHTSPYTGTEPVTVPAGHCWVESDEPFHGQDSTHFGPISMGLVQAKAIAIYYPFHRMQWVN